MAFNHKRAGFLASKFWNFFRFSASLSVHIRAISHNHMTYAKTVPSWLLLNLKVVQVT